MSKYDESDVDKCLPVTAYSGVYLKIYVELEKKNENPGFLRTFI